MNVNLYCPSVTALTHIWATEGLELSSWQTKDNVAVDSQIRPPACSEYPSVRTSLTLYSVLEVTFIFIYDTLILTILHLHYCSLAGEELTTTVKWRQFVKTAMLQAGA